MSGISGVQEHKAVSGEDRRAVSTLRRRSRDPQERKRVESTMDVRTIRTVILCLGRSHPRKNVRTAEAIWSKREISWSAQMKNAVMWKI